ncbi:MAG: fibronectin type III domain-containing protein [Patescibacteria group bacterium]|nr:fibronectin type III domain-containing protein [Patescibacteria group bacterium]
MDQRTSTWRTVGIVIIVVLLLSLLHYIFTNFSKSVHLLGSGLTAFVSAFGGPSGTSLTAISGLTGIAGNGEVTLVWPNQYSQNPNVVYYIYKGTAPGTETYYAQTSNTGFTDQSVTNGRTYYYRVAPVLINNGLAPQIGPLSNEVALTPRGAGGGGGAVSAFVPILGQLAGVAGPGFDSLAWSVQSNGGAAILGYRVYRRTNGGALAAVATTNDTSYVDYNVSSGNSYTYEIRGFNRIGFSSPSNSIVLIPSGQAQVSIAISSAPGQITNLNAVAGIGQASLIWSAPSEGSSPISYYNVYRGTSSGGESFIRTVNSPSYVDANVVNGTTYYYKVIAVNSVGSSPYSNEVSATPTQPAPSVSSITNLVASAGYGQISLAWSSPSSNGQITGYNIYRSANGSGNFSYYAQTQGNYYTDMNVSAGTYYYYYVAALVNGSQSGQSNIVSASPLTQNTTPVAITNLSASAANNAIVLNWNYSGNTQAAYFKVYRGTGGGNVSFYTSTNGGASTFTDSGVSAGTTYFYQVSAVSSSGTEGPLSNEVSATIPQQQQQQSPSQVSNLQAAAQSSGIALNWSYSGTQVSQFNVYRGVNGGSIGFYTTSNSSNYFLDAGVQPGNTYYYQVAAVVNGVIGPLSNTASAAFAGTTQTQTQSQTPSQITSLSGSQQSNSISLSWSYSGSSISYYKIYRGVNNGSPSFYVTTSNSNYADTSVSSGNTYYYQVSAVNNMGTEGPLSNLVNVSYTVTQQATQPSTPSQIINLSGSQQSNGIGLNWSYSGPAVSYYNVYRGVNSGSTTYYGRETGGPSFLDTSVSSGNTYYYQVSGVNSTGVEGPLSNEVSVVYNVQQTTQTQTQTQTQQSTSQLTEYFTVGNPNMTVNNGGTVYMYAAPAITNGTYYIPIREPMQTFGASVNWSSNPDGTDESVTINFNGTTAEIWINRDTATVNGQTVSIAPPYLAIVNNTGFTMVPVSFLEQYLGITANISGNNATLSH